MKPGAAVAQIVKREGADVISCPRNAALAQTAGDRAVAIGRGIEQKGEGVCALLEFIAANAARASQLQQEKGDKRC